MMDKDLNRREFVKYCGLSMGAVGLTQLSRTAHAHPGKSGNPAARPGGAKVVDYHKLKRQWSAPGVPKVPPHFISIPFFKKEDGISLTLRYHVLLPGDRPDPALHTHAWEHHTFTICGRGLLLLEDGEIPIREGLVCFVPGNLPHIMTPRGDVPWVCIDCINYVE